MTSMGRGHSLPAMAPVLREPLGLFWNAEEVRRTGWKEKGQRQRDQERTAVAMERRREGNVQAIVEIDWAWGGGRRTHPGVTRWVVCHQTRQDTWEDQRTL